MPWNASERPTDLMPAPSVVGTAKSLRSLRALTWIAVRIWYPAALVIRPLPAFSTPAAGRSRSPAVSPRRVLPEGSVSR